MLRRIYYVFFAALVAPSIAYASHCAQVLANDRLIECLAEDFDVTDKRLNKVYKSLRSGLSAEDVESLKQAQRAWLVKREDECEAKADESRGGQVYVPLFLQCQIDMTNTRVMLLRSKKW